MIATSTSTKLKFEMKAINSYTGRDSEYHDYRIVSFLHNNIQPYKADKETILRSLDYVYSKNQGKGGFILLGIQEGEITGCVVINETGMEGYNAENILVYLAIDPKFKNTGLEKRLIDHSKKLAKGCISTYVDPSFASNELYRQIGFQNRNVELRLG